MSEGLTEIFEYLDGQGHSQIRALEACLRDVGYAVDYWRGRPLRAREGLPSEVFRLLHHPSLSDEPAVLAQRLYEAQPQLDIVESTFGGLRILDYVCQFAKGEPLRDSVVAEVMDILQRNGNRMFTWLLILAADRNVQTDRDIAAIPFLFKHAIEAAPRPSLHNEIGAALLIRAGLEPDNLSGFNDVVLSVVSFDEGEPELPSLRFEGAPVVPLYRTQIVQLAADAFARAYGYCAYRAEHETLNEETRNLYFEACRALDGLRVTAQELEQLDLLELAYSNYFVWDDVVTEGGTFPIDPYPIDTREFLRRFAFSVGLSRGKRQRLAVGEAQRVIESPTSPGLVAEIAEAVTRAVRSASEGQLREGQSAAAERAGPVWVDLPNEVRDQLAQAEYMESVLWHSSFDWAPVALPYFRAIEILLQGGFGKSFKEHLARREQRFLSKYLEPPLKDLTKLTIGQFAYLIRHAIDDPETASFIRTTPLRPVGRLRQVPNQLSYLTSQFRNLGTHAGPPWGGAKIRDLKRVVYENSSLGDSLLSVLAQLSKRQGA